MKRIDPLWIGMLMFLGWGGIAWAQGEKVLVNQKLASKVEEILKSALTIRLEQEGQVFLPLTEQSFAPQTQFVFFRRRGTRLSMVAQGVVEGEREGPSRKGRELVVRVDKDTIVKYPQVGDLGVPLADPAGVGLGEKRENTNAPVVPIQEPRDRSRPGFLQAGAGILFGQLFSNANPQVGGGKNSFPYRFMNIQFDYFSGLFPIGIGMSSHSGRLPTQTYEGDVVNSSQSIRYLNFYYRFRPLFSETVFFTAKVFQLSDELTTDNQGSELFSTKISALGAGLKMQINFLSDVWKPSGSSIFGVGFQSIFGEAGFSPMVSAQDGSPSRGTSSEGSTLLDYRVGATGFLWLGFVPLLKRWFIQGSWGVRSYSLQFQGPTVSEVGNPVPVPTGVSMNESEKDYRFIVGFRVQDPLELLLGGEEKKEGGQP